ncbi:hypothetical protein LPTSP4_19080 [Leptospira ryugenii]|uniref:Uncharacterized protein n=1 Tax=Leptospira ryugenii TaxID=1917863 RepID=A0A2P2E0I3_9LEPT|nr:PcfJ domain-containing protein [Leptospira ryugenii]GBF50383.1 hypothetical protein LPTSP4_19080 [Leptospira ryugenii]
MDVPAIYLVFGNETEITQKKRRDILIEAGYDPALRKPLERMTPDLWNLESIVVFKKIFADPKYRKHLLHLKQINANLLRFFSLLRARNQRPKLHIRFLENLMQESLSDDELLQICQLIEEIDLYKPHWKFRSIADVYKLESTMIQELENSTFQEEVVSYPEPPFEGNEWISPIRSNLDLYWEGKNQHNCVFDYDQKIRDGRFYLYHTNGKTKCTVSFLNIEGDWFLDQIAGPCNKPADPETYHQLEAWRLRNGILILGDVFRMGLPASWMLE